MTQRKLLSTGAPNPKHKPGASGASGKGGHSRTAFERATFCAWDGEGANINGKHEYILLAHSRGGSVDNCVSGLETRRCLQYLTDVSRGLGRYVVHVCFGMSYDVNMILRDLSRDDVQHLWQGEAIDWMHFNIQYRHRKQFTVRTWDAAHKWEQNKDGKWKRRWTHSMCLWDVWGYFQGTFVNAIREWLGNEYEKELLDVIETHKTQRANFQPSEIDTITEYCALEVQALQKLMEKVHSHLLHLAIPVRRWDGAGSVAAALLRKHDVKTHMAHDTPPHILTYARHAYAGGRIELVRYGYHNGSIYSYDINSAYPSAMLGLPSLAAGHWERADAFLADSFAMWEVEWNLSSLLADGQATVFPFFFRAPDGTISYPTTGNGIYWSPEVQSALDIMTTDFQKQQCMSIKGGYIWRASSNDKPFAFVQELYNARQAMKANGDGAQKVLKLGLNSLYGKLAQQIGGHDGQKPPYHCLEWAGYITSITRARLFRLAYPGTDTIFIATDGITFAAPRTNLDTGSGIGQWEESHYGGMLAVQSGVYWCYKTADDSKPKAYYRGFDKGQLHPGMVIDAYRAGKTSVLASSTRFIGMGSALASRNFDAVWRTWGSVTGDTTRELKLTPYGTKRQDRMRNGKHKDPSKGLIPTDPKENPYTDISVPYPLRWTDGNWEQQSGVTLDGTLVSIVEQEVEDSYV